MNCSVHKFIKKRTKYNFIIIKYSMSLLVFLISSVIKDRIIIVLNDRRANYLKYIVYGSYALPPSRGQVVTPE